MKNEDLGQNGQLCQKGQIVAHILVYVSMYIVYVCYKFHVEAMKNENRKKGPFFCGHPPVQLKLYFVEVRMGSASRIMAGTCVKTYSTLDICPAVAPKLRSCSLSTFSLPW